MLKQRIIPVLLYKDIGLVKGIGFNSWRRVGPVIPAVKVHNLRNVDELIFLDIGATPENREPDFDLIADISDECFMPLTVGGGVSKPEHFRELLLAGADKVSVNTAALNDPSLLERASQKFGAQCVTVSIDVLKGRVATGCGLLPHDLSPVTWAKECERLGAGEILLNSIERDGMMEGYDIGLIRSVSQAVDIPVIACGGAGTYEHFAEGLRYGHAVAAGAIFQFTEHTPQGAAQYLQDKGHAVRTDNRRFGNAWKRPDSPSLEGRL